MSSVNVTTTPRFLDGPYDYYLWTLTLSDRRTKGWFFVDSPIPTVVCVAAYLFFVWIGPKVMKNRKPFKLLWLLRYYNLAMALLNYYICSYTFMSATRLGYSYVCEPTKPLFTPDELQIANCVWWFYMSKLFEFADTIFFILRKKDNQLTFLHIYHHSTMFPLWWIGIKWVASGSSFLPVLINSGVHVVMYTYYGLSTFSSLQKYLWWKKYLTTLQLIQFSIGLVLGINGLIIHCDFPLWMHYTLIGYMISFIVLFGRFYVTKYINSYRNRNNKNKNDENVTITENNGNVIENNGNVTENNVYITKTIEDANNNDNKNKNGYKQKVN